MRVSTVRRQASLLAALGLSSVGTRHAGSEAREIPGEQWPVIGYKHSQCAEGLPRHPRVTPVRLMLMPAPLDGKRCLRMTVLEAVRLGNWRALLVSKTCTYVLLGDTRESCPCRYFAIIYAAEYHFGPRLARSGDRNGHLQVLSRAHECCAGIALHAETSRQFRRRDGGPGADLSWGTRLCSLLNWLPS